MSRGRFAGLIIAALLVITIASYMSMRRNAPHEGHDALLFPGLAGELSTVSAVDVRKGSATPSVSLRKKGDQWIVVQRADYPADISKLRKLLLSMIDAKILEQKTSDPARYAVINVDDPTKPGASGTQVDFTVKDGSHTLIVGKPSGENNFVRRGGEATSYLVAPGIYVETEPRLWIDTKLLNIPADDIDRIDYKPASGTPYSVHRVVPPAPAPGAPQRPSEFVLEGAPPGRKPADSPTLSPPPSAVGDLTADDVAAIADIDFSKPASTIITMKDGATITVTGTIIGDKHWIQVTAPKDQALTGRTAGRAFQVAAYRYDGLFRPLEQLLVPKPAPPDKSAKQPSAPSPRAPAKQPSSAP